MALDLPHLDQITREYMLKELERDIESRTIYLSPRLNPAGLEAYPALMREAISSYNNDWLAIQIEADGLLNPQEQRRNRSGGYSIARVPITAPVTLAEGEFNRFYIRGLCLRALDEGILELEIYRAKAVSNPRSDSLLLVGTLESTEKLLEDARRPPGDENATGIPHGPNSGLSVKFP